MVTARMAAARPQHGAFLFVLNPSLGAKTRARVLPFWVTPTSVDTTYHNTMPTSTSRHLPGI